MHQIWEDLSTSKELQSLEPGDAEHAEHSSTRVQVALLRLLPSLHAEFGFGRTWCSSPGAGGWGRFPAFVAACDGAAQGEAPHLAARLPVLGLRAHASLVSNTWCLTLQSGEVADESTALTRDQLASILQEVRLVNMVPMLAFW